MRVTPITSWVQPTAAPQAVRQKPVGLLGQSSGMWQLVGNSPPAISPISQESNPNYLSTLLQAPITQNNTNQFAAQVQKPRYRQIRDYGSQVPDNPLMGNYFTFG